MLAKMEANLQRVIRAFSGPEVLVGLAGRRCCRQLAAEGTTAGAVVGAVDNATAGTTTGAVVGEADMGTGGSSAADVPSALTSMPTTAPASLDGATTADLTAEFTADAPPHSLTGLSPTPARSPPPAAPRAAASAAVPHGPALRAPPSAASSTSRALAACRTTRLTAVSVTFAVLADGGGGRPVLFRVRPATAPTPSLSTPRVAPQLLA